MNYNTDNNTNPLWKLQRRFLDSAPPLARDNLFSFEIKPENRAEIWSRQRDAGE